MSDIKSDWKEYFKLFTPFMIIIVSLIGWSIKEQVNDMRSNILSIQCQVVSIDDKIFKHLTNEEIHMPRSTIATKGEFDLVYQVRERQFIELKQAINNLSLDVKTIMLDRGIKLK